MGTVTATKNGNWSDTSVWDTGVVPVNGDEVDALTRTITFDVDINQPNTVLKATSGNFRYSGTGTRTVVAQANVGNHTTQGLIQNASTGTLVFDGAVRGGSGTNAFGANNAATGTLTVTTATGGSGNSALGANNASSGTLTVTTATGGSGSSAVGALNASSGTLTVTTATGGSGTSAHGAQNASSGTLTVTTATGGSGSSAHGANNFSSGTLTVTTATGGSGSSAVGALNASSGTLNCDLAVGNNYGPGGTHSNNNPGVFGNNTVGQVTTVKRIQFGPYGAIPVSGAVLLLADATNSAQFRTALNGATKTLTDNTAAADYPTVGNVRAGIKYANNDRTGTLAVPAAGSVALGVAVDNTTGTAVLTQANAAAAVWNAARGSYTTDGTFGDVAEWAGSVDTGAIADAVWDEVLEGTLTIQQAMRVMLAALANKSNGGGTASITFRDLADTKARISATVDSNGNRTAVTVDGS